MNPLKSTPRKRRAIAYIVNGLTAQLTKSVSPTGRALLPALRTSAKSIFTMIGYIMKKRQTAIGIETTGAPRTVIDSPSRYEATVGAILPSTIPAAIQSATHAVRYFSKKPSPFGSLTMHAFGSIDQNSIIYANSLIAGAIFFKPLR